MSTQTKHSTIYGVGLGSPNPYPDGGFWYSIDWQEWGELIGTDLCFKTYGQGRPPNIPEIDGPINGEIGITYDYNFTAIDPDEDDVWYYIEWGDGDVEEWIGPYSSGEEVVRSHTWDDEDTYTIRAKAKDIFDAESDWGTLEVTMPVNQHSYSFPLLQRLLERFPNAFPILRHLIETQC